MLLVRDQLLEVGVPFFWSAREIAGLSVNYRAPEWSSWGSYRRYVADCPLEELKFALGLDKRVPKLQRSQIYVKPGDLGRQVVVADEVFAIQFGH